MTAKDIKMPDTSSKEYVKWMADVWKKNHERNNPVK